MAAAHAAQGVRRFSLVTSGRRVAPEQIERFCKLFKEIKERTPISLCASMGLVDADGMKRLREAGVTRYHCNLETGSSYFGTLCTTHTHADKLRTIAAAREAGLEVCSGGIIGMGETPVQRLQLAREVRDAGAVSIPVNILNPIPGTPLENTPLISDDEVIRTCALFRFIAPRVTIRFAGGRRRLPEASVERMLRGGVNGAMMGDLLTTAGNGCEADKSLFRRAGYEM